MARQPLNSRLPNTGFALGPETLSQRPTAAVLIAECIATWAEIELQTGRLIGEMLGVPFEPVTAFYLSLANQKEKRKTLDPIAQYFFKEQIDLDLYEAMMRARSSSENERINLAHSLFGIASDDPEGIIMISTSDRIRHMFEIDAITKMQTEFGMSILGGLISPEMMSKREEIKKYIYHYELKDLFCVLSDMKSLNKLIIQFSMLAVALRMGNLKVVDMLRKEIVSLPLVCRFLSQTPTDPGRSF
jgi:hypothetical protein